MHNNSCNTIKEKAKRFYAASCKQYAFNYCNALQY